MSRPFKHPRTGIYWLRRRVPQDLVAVVGHREIQRSLGTRDPAEAKQKLVQALAELDAQWAALKKGPREITEREAHAYAVSVHDAWLAKHCDNPSYQEFWLTNLHSRLWPNSYLNGREPVQEESSEDIIDIISDKLWVEKMRNYCYEAAEKILSRYGFAKDSASMWKTARAVSEAMQRASLTLEREERGVYEPGTAPRQITTPLTAHMDEGSTPSRGNDRHPPKQSATTRKSSLNGLVEAWWREAQATGRKPSTYESYSNTFANFGRFLGHDDAGRVTADDVIRFKDHRLTTPSPKTGRVASAKTVKGTDLTALKTVFGWAVANRQLPENPAGTVTMKVGKAPRLRSKGFSDAEAEAILQAALELQPGRASRQTAAGKRWVPWLCALTGARVGEMGQLRKQDLYQWNEHWILRITPEAGTVKTNEAREVVLHPQLVDLGFPAFVQEAPDGPLFVRLGKDGDVLKPLQGLKNRLAEFARTIVSDPNVAPMHGFRHRFKTAGRDVGVDPRIIDAFQGHAARSVGEAYGDVSLTAMAAAIARFPPIKIGKGGEARPAVNTTASVS